MNVIRSGTTWQAFIAVISKREGSDTAVARRLGFADGSRISEWRRGTNRRPSAVTCLRLALFYDYHPLDVLAIGGHVELASLLLRRIPDMERPVRSERNADIVRKIRAVVRP